MTHSHLLAEKGISYMDDVTIDSENPCNIMAGSQVAKMGEMFMIKWLIIK